MRHMRDLPNQEGFQFVGVTHDGDLMECVVTKPDNICHSVENEYGEPCFMKLAGWVNKGERV